MSDLIANIERLCAIPGVSGDEGAVRAEIMAQLKDCCICERDPLGNLLVHKKGAKTPKNKLLVAAHMDEVGFVITGVDDTGLLRFDTVGGIDARVIVGKAVEIGEKRLYGVIGAKATHQLEDKEKDEPIPADKLYIDIGAADKAGAETHVRPGDRAVFSSGFMRLGAHKILGRALDDRAGCALLIALIKSDLEYDCSFAFTVQEETGCTGAAAAGYSINPDISVVVEATTAGDLEDAPPGKAVCEQGRGPVISFMDRGAVYDTQLYRLAMQTAEANKIPAQPKAGVFGGNDSKALQTVRAGVRAVSVSLPCRYIHSPGCTLELSDITHTLALLKKLLPVLAEENLP